MEEQVLELAKKVSSQAEVFAVRSVETPVAFEANRLKQLQTKETRGISLRVIVDGRLGLASSTRWDDPQDLVDTAVSMARFGAEARFEMPAAAAVPVVKVYDERVAALTVEDLVAMGQALVKKVRAHDSAILCDAEVSAGTSTVRVLNSRGSDCTTARTVFSAGIHGNLVRGTDMLDIYEDATSCRAAENLAELAEALIRKAEMANNIAVVRTGDLPVIFTPKGVAMTLMAPLGLAFSGKMVAQGASPLCGKVGAALADERFSLYDDGSLDWAPSSGPCDHEGVPCRRTPLIQSGVVSGFYYDLQTAALAGVCSTGNGRRSPDSLPSPSTTSLVVLPGSTSLADMIASVSDGLLVDQTMGAWSGNLISGEFSGNVHLGYKIEGGKIVGRVKDTMVAGNILHALRDLEAIGREAEWSGGVLTPALYFRSLSVAGK